MALRKVLFYGLTAAWCVCAMRETRTLTVAWSSNVTLWQRGVIESPAKPRAWINYGAALGVRHDYAGALQAWTLAEQAAALPWVPAWDRLAVQQIVPVDRRIVEHLQQP